MFDRVNYSSHESVTNVKNIFNIPNEYNLYHHGENDDVERIEFYIKNKGSISDAAIWADILSPITSEIDKKVSDYMMRHYDGKSHVILIEVTDRKFVLALSIDRTRFSMHLIVESIRDKFNIDCNICLSEDVLQSKAIIRIELLDRINDK